MKPLTSTLFPLYYRLWPPARQDTLINRERYFYNRYIIKSKPYPRHLYSDLISRISRRKWLRFAHFCEMGPVPGDESWVFARHDIDSTECLKKLDILLEIDDRFMVPAAIFLRMDGEPYDPAECRSVAAACRERGHEVGLHTSCYMHDDFMKAFTEETRKFQDVLGFQPQCFTTHGTGKRQDVRQLFNEEIKDRLGEFGYLISDCHPSLKTYEYAIGDSYLDPASNQRVLRNDFRDIPSPYLGRGRSYMILTHPHHWY